MQAPWSQIYRDANAGTLDEISSDALSFSLKPDHPGLLFMRVRAPNGSTQYHHELKRIESPSHLKLLAEGVLTRHFDAERP